MDAESAPRPRASAFVAASVEGRTRQATELLDADPGIPGGSLLAAVVVGDAAAVGEMLAANQEAAVATDDDRGWPPLLYACYSHWHQIDPSRAPGLADVVRALLAAGANPNTNDGGRPRYRSALKGSVELNNPAITEVLLDAGANPDAGQPIGEAIGRGDHRCLQLLLSHGARVAGTWAIGAAVFHDDPVALSLLLESLRAGGIETAKAAGDELPEAAANASLEVVTALLDAGADANTADGDDVSALRRAVRAGKDDTAALLRARGARDDSTAVDRFVGACLSGRRDAAERWLADDPELQHRMTDEDRGMLVDAAASRPATTVALMLDLGFSPHTSKFGEQPLHTAAYHGNAEAVRVLLEAGADVDARDARFDATPLAFATVGSRERVGEPGDWIGTVGLLIEAGASLRDVWVAEKPPSEEVIDVLVRHGVTPDEPLAQQDDGADVVGSVGTGILADIARHLESSYADQDLDLLASLLHPDVHWTGVCTNRGEVIDWYRGLLAEGTSAIVRSVEVDGDAVVLGLDVARHAEGARPAAPQQLYQVFTVVDDQIVDIRGYPDRRSALAR